MTTKLTNMSIDEISIVDDPANEAARVEIVKAKGFKPCEGCKSPDACIEKRQCQADVSKGKPKDFGDAMKRETERVNAYKMFDDIYKATDALRSAIMGTIEDVEQDDRPAVVGKNIDAFVEYIKGLAPSILAKARAGDGDDPAADAAQLQEMMMNIEQLSKALEDAEANLATLEKRAADAEKRATEAEAIAKAKAGELAELKKSAGGETEDVLKSLPEAIRKRFEEAEAKTKAAEDAIAKMKDESEVKEAIAKAKDLGIGKAEDVGPLLVRVTKGKTTADDAKTLEQLLKSAGEVASKSNLFRSMGSTVAEGVDPDALLKGKAEDIRKAKPELSFEQAYTKAVEANPDLYSAYIAKRRG